MADKITEEKILAIGLEYEGVTSEGPKTKTAYVKIPNPKTNLTEQQIKNVAMQLISGEGAILRDAEGDDFDTETAIVTAYTESVKKTVIDIGIE